MSRLLLVNFCDCIMNKISFKIDNFFHLNQLPPNYEQGHRFGKFYYWAVRISERKNKNWGFATEILTKFAKFKISPVHSWVVTCIGEKNWTHSLAEDVPIWPWHNLKAKRIIDRVVERLYLINCLLDGHTD